WHRVGSLPARFRLKSRRRSQSVNRREHLKALWSLQLRRQRSPSKPLAPSSAEETLTPQTRRTGTAGSDARKSAGFSTSSIADSDWAADNPTERSFLLVNRCTGQFRSHAPNSIYRARRLRQKISRIAELEEELRLARVFFGKWKVDRERMDNESSCRNLPRRVLNLLRLEHSYEKLKAEQSKKDDLLKQKDAELLRRLKQIRALEEKGLKVDELTAEVANDFGSTLLNSRNKYETKTLSLNNLYNCSKCQNGS
uniref:BMERB domain-containing protein n=1 Tax=Macrostomum lignano TaxID=282301 RepID=A0A1I8FLU2_9PLAT